MVTVIEHCIGSSTHHKFEVSIFDNGCALLTIEDINRIEKFLPRNSFQICCDEYDLRELYNVLKNIYSMEG